MNDETEITSESPEIESPEIESVDIDSTDTGEESVSKKDPDRIIRSLNAALKEERMRIKAEKERARSLEDTFQRFVSQTTQQQQRPIEQPKIPDPTEDLGGYLYAKQQGIENAVQQLAYSRQQEELARQQYMQKESLLNTYRASAANYSKRAPDFNEAYNSLMQSRVSELELMGFSQADAVNIATNDELAMVHQALSNGLDPAERIYKLAKQRGYRGNSNAETTLAAAAAANNNVSGLPGIPAKKQISLDQLSKLEGDDFLKAWDKIMKG